MEQEASSFKGWLQKPLMLAGILGTALVLAVLGFMLTQHQQHPQHPGVSGQSQANNTSNSSISSTSTLQATVTQTQAGNGTPAAQPTQTSSQSSNSSSSNDVNNDVNSLQRVDSAAATGDQNMQGAVSDGSTDYSSQDQEVQP